MISPISVNYALYMTYSGADGETKEEMETALKLNGLDSEELNEQMHHLANYLEYGGVDLQIANSIWGRKNRVEFLDTFQDDMKDYYNARMEELDFNDPEASDTINNWVAENTEDKIEEMVPDNIPNGVLVYLINAIYFNGNWDIPFPEENTREDTFITEKGEERTVDMMSISEEEFSYLENNLFQAVALPYEDESYQMTLYLPQEENSLEDFYNEMNSQNWKKWQKEFMDLEGEVKLPKFKMEYEIELNDVLKDMGMETPFEDADLSKMFHQSQGIYISEVLHKSFIEVDEKGTEAAAATSVAVEEAASMHEFQIEFNRPFFYAIENTEVDTILFMGVVHDPTLD
ncbi:proteinase inhibitor I4 serpin [Natranaerobius thermophilus JW/NM-WN-LF]|uniref:Proteinase inhibitor I4 serpin n=2 Tax=Natranaerobius TaxID=375928 RepID=B2A7B4_NATTJ|nr:proteinase inhibitor I4 serpin [Natranaerobius thermophilus JW/NM-WN-LF]